MCVTINKMTIDVHTCPRYDGLRWSNRSYNIFLMCAYENQMKIEGYLCEDLIDTRVMFYKKKIRFTKKKIYISRSAKN